MKKILVTATQIGVSAGLLYWIFKDPAKDAQMLSAVKLADPRWLLAALVMAFVPVVGGTTRWVLLLRVQGIGLSWWSALRLYLIGTFFNLFLFGATGGDVIKAFYLLRAAPGKKAGALLTVVLDRTFGLLALVGIAAVFVALRHEWLASQPESAKLVLAYELILAGAIGAILAAALIIGFGLVKRLPAHMPGHLKLVELNAACQLYGHHWRTSLGAILLSLVCHGCTFTVFYCGVRALRAVVHFWDMMALMPIVQTITALPISFSGVGVREGLLKQLLGDLCGVPESQAVPISLMGYIFSALLPGVIGGVVYVLFRSTAGPAPGAEAREHLEEDIVGEELPASPSDA